MNRLTATDVARGLSELLNRVEYLDEEFEVERNGRVVARIVPPERRAGGLSDLVEALEKIPRDPSFADDLEAIQAEQPTVPDDTAWDS